MKKLINIFIVIMMIFILSGCDKKEDAIEITDAQKFKEEYESLNGTVSNNQEIRTVSIDEDNPMIYKNAGDIVEMINNKETFIVYFGFNTCPWCRSVIETLIDVAKDNNINTIYYVDVKDIRDVITYSDDNFSATTKGSDDYYKLLELFDSVLDDYTITDENGNSILTGEKRIYAPNVVTVINGVPKELETGISDLQTNPYMELTEEIIKDTYGKFKCLATCLNESKTTCSYDTKC